ncbi:MAG: hypothetical protein HY319_26760 [Armatimonadetes bacterium]|nr:hypothetical protein [Armatimonadota bacterium]
MQEERIPRSRKPWFGRAMFFLFAVLVPLVTWGVEIGTRMCAECLFDPMPTAVHSLLILMVPVANFVVRRDVEWGDRLRPGIGLLSGMAVGVAGFYTVMFAPLTPLGVVTIPFCGIGFLLLAPALSLIGALSARAMLGRKWGIHPPGFWRGVGIAMLVLLLAELPGAATRLGMHAAAGGSHGGLSMLRAIGDEEFMLRSCYVRPSSTTDMLSFLLSLDDPLDPEEARKIYYRVTGRPFNASPPPPSVHERGLLADEDWVWDSEQGAEDVGGRLKHLFLEDSIMVATLDPDAALGYTEWTLVFRNDHGWQNHEARAQIALPPGGTVSRVTLWVEGEPREAAFGSRSQTRQAYEEVVQQSRDPLLVTTAGPDRVMLQCFPVPARGGTMKVRIGITAPLELESNALTLARLPYFVERNFTQERDVPHTVKVDSPATLEATRLESPELGRLEGKVPDLYLADVLIQAARDPSVRRVWASDRTGTMVTGALREAAPGRPERPVFVVDGSSRMQSVVQEISAAMPATRVIFAGDELQEMPASELGGASFVGGQDAVPALMRAFAEPGATVVYIHAPQPVELAPVEELRPLVQKGSRLYDFQVGLGPNRVLEALDGLENVEVVRRRGSVGEDLQGFLAGLEEPRLQMLLSQITVPAGEESSDHLVRLWAASQVEDLRGKGHLDEAVKLAVGQQLVTPVSGAVVLENTEQYERAGLQAVDPGTVPTIPEPEVWALVLVCLAVLALARQRRAGVLSEARRGPHRRWTADGRR